MMPFIIAALVGIVVYMVIIALLPKHLLSGNKDYTRTMINKLSKDKGADFEENFNIFRDEDISTDLMTKVFMVMPGAKAIYPTLLKAGLGKKIGTLFTIWLLFTFIAAYVLKALGVTGILIALLLSVFLANWYIKSQIQKRNLVFLNYFPDALDMLVRSVRSGYPLNSAVRMVADNMQPPVSTEFKQVADEVAYGSTLIEALERLSRRIDEPDVRFFVVVLTVQQDIGGNLSETLQNLSSIIRKRKHLRLKIKALASEGKATGWVLGSLPFVEALVLFFMTPEHLTPLITTPTGHMLLAVTAGIMCMGFFIVRQIIRIKV